MGFWKTLFQVCSGTEVFLKLLDCRPGKALLHFLLLLCLLAFVLAWGHSCMAVPKIRTVCGSLFQETGSFRFVPEKGIRTTRNAEKKQSYLLDDQLRFDYYPGSSLTEADIKNWTTPFGLIVMDNGMVFWAENYAEPSSGKYLAAPFLLDQNLVKAETFHAGLSGKELYGFLKEKLEQKPGQKISFLLQEADRKLVTDYLISCLSVMIFLAAWIGMLLLSVAGVFFFCMMQFLWFAAVERHPTLRQILVILIYLTFPALIIAGLYSFFMIPQISPQTVFFTAYLIYYMVIFRKIRLKLNPPGKPEISDDDF